MVKLHDEDIRTREVLAWKGLHVFHMSLSSCSQKVRVYMNLKGLQWESHPVNLMANEQLSDYFLGINPRGLVPVLIDDGEVHIESNDILLHLEHKFPEPSLMPAGREQELRDKLTFEDDLHMDLRRLSFRFLFAPPGPPKSVDDLEKFEAGGSGTVEGKQDASKAREIAFWRDYMKNDGIPDDDVRKAAATFKTAFDVLDEQLAATPYLMGDAISILDIAWIIYVQRLAAAGYPIARLHPHVAAWFDKQAARPEVASEITFPADVASVLGERQKAIAEAGKTLDQVCFS